MGLCESDDLSDLVLELTVGSEALREAGARSLSYAAISTPVVLTCGSCYAPRAVRHGGKRIQMDDNLTTRATSTAGELLKAGSRPSSR
jgi:hypothetical protein